MTPGQGLVVGYFIGALAGLILGLVLGWALWSGSAHPPTEGGPTA